MLGEYADTLTQKREGSELADFGYTISGKEYPMD